MTSRKVESSTGTSKFIKTKRHWAGYYKVFREDGQMFLISYSMRTYKWRVYAVPEVYRDKIPETAPDLFIDEFPYYRDARKFVQKVKT